MCPYLKQAIKVAYVGIFQKTISRAFATRGNQAGCHECSKCKWKMISIDMNAPNKNKLNCE